MLSELKEITIGIPGVFIEDNRFCISVHYRHVKDNVSFELMSIILLSYNTGTKNKFTQPPTITNFIHNFILPFVLGLSNPRKQSPFGTWTALWLSFDQRQEGF